MSPQADYVVANASGSAFRADLNNQLAAIVANNSGATEPATMFAFQWWADTTTGTLKLRNASNNAWVTIGTLASTNLGLLSLAGGTMTGALVAALGTSSVPGISFAGDLDTGLSAAAPNTLVLSTNGTARLTASITAVTSSLPVIVPDGSAAAASVAFNGSGTDTGLFSPAADSVAITTGGTARLTASTTEISSTLNFNLNAQSDLRFSDLDSSHYIAVQAPSTVSSNVTFTLPSADGTGGQVLSTNGSGTLSFADVIPSGTVMLFVQSAAPTGWTKSTTHDNKALRVVSGAVSSGGTQNFSAVLNGSVDATTLTTAQIPSHTHAYSMRLSSGGGGDTSDSNAGGLARSGSLYNGAQNSESASNAGAGGSHTHSMDVAYVDVIIATKN